MRTCAQGLISLAMLFWAMSDWFVWYMQIMCLKFHRRLLHDTYVWLFTDKFLMYATWLCDGRVTAVTVTVSALWQYIVGWVGAKKSAGSERKSLASSFSEATDSSSKWKHSTVTRSEPFLQSTVFIEPSRDPFTRHYYNVDRRGRYRYLSSKRGTDMPSSIFAM